jgi:hypothetical protein
MPRVPAPRLPARAPLRRRGGVGCGAAADATKQEQGEEGQKEQQQQPQQQPQRQPEQQAEEPKDADAPAANGKLPQAGAAGGALAAVSAWGEARRSADEEWPGARLVTLKDVDWGEPAGPAGTAPAPAHACCAARAPRGAA